MPGEVWRIVVVTHPSPLLDAATDLRYTVLHEPFGVERDDDWNDRDPSSTHLVALVEDDVVGYARLIAEQGVPCGQIRQVVVRPEWERRGIGTSLIEEAAREARAQGLIDIWLNARMTAVPFYEKLGFRVTSGVFRTARTYLPHVRMDRAL